MRFSITNSAFWRIPASSNVTWDTTFVADSTAITKVSPEGIISLDGKVTTPKKDTDVIVTITVTDAEGKTASHDFTVKVIGLNEVDKETPKDPETGKDTPKDPTQDKKPAKTGDATSIASWISMMTVAGAMLLKRKKRS